MTQERVAPFPQSQGHGQSSVQLHEPASQQPHGQPHTQVPAAGLFESAGSAEESPENAAIAPRARVATTVVLEMFMSILSDPNVC